MFVINCRIHHYLIKTNSLKNSSLSHKLMYVLDSANVVHYNDDYVLCNKDIISNIIHKHEPYVMNYEIPIIYEDNDIVVVNKPSGMSTHPGGRYNYNSVLTYLEEEKKCKLFVVHRLDRLTSGVLIFAKSSNKAREIQFGFGKCHKSYICRVIGNMESCVVDKPIKETECITLSKVHIDENGKPSKTSFEKVFYDDKSDTTVVIAKPETGRMHQIRVHLLSIGHPIANDSMYRDMKENVIVDNVKDEFKCDSCDECKRGVSVSLEELWLHAFEYKITINGKEVTFTTDKPQWSDQSFDAKVYIEHWIKVHSL